MKKNKTIKILAIVSFVILVLGIIIWFLIGSSISHTNDLAQAISIVSALLFQIIVAIITVSLIALIWLIYGLIMLIKRIKDGKMNWKRFAIISISILLIIAIALILLDKNKENNLATSILQFQQLKIIF